MGDIVSYQRLLGQIELGMLIVMALFGNLPIFVIVTVGIAAYLIVRGALNPQYTVRQKVLLGVTYGFAMVLQIVFDVNGVFIPGWGHIVMRVIAAGILPLPLLLERLVIRNKTDAFYLPSLSELATISFAEFEKNKTKIRQAMQGADKVKSVFSADNVQDIFGDLHRHSSVHYVNDGSLNEEYFERVKASLADPALYIVISNTGSAASELIALFTQKQFNHASLSFDRDLTTIISYNGGERVYPPGLNPEMVAAFHKKADASVLVYRLPVTVEQKQRVIDTVKQINDTGSAYNILGLVTKRSLRRNIMFCSQFVYKMLQKADATYFDKQPGDVRPTDFVELDYYRHLEYVDEIKF